MNARGRFKWLAAISASLAVLAVCLVPLCDAKPSRGWVLDAGTGGLVSGVPVADLARAIAEGVAPPLTEDAENAEPRRLEPFLLAVTTIRMPDEPAHVKCKWQPQGVRTGNTDSGEERDLGRFQSYKVVALDNDSQEIGARPGLAGVGVGAAGLRQTAYRRCRC
jgi:hypothetical protein